MTSSEQYLIKHRLLRIIVPFFGTKKKAFVISCAFIPDLTSVVQYVDNVIRRIIVSTQWITQSWYP